MTRAAVFIGVDRPGGGLPPLADAARGAMRMAAWAERQGVDHLEVLTDADGGSVGVADVKRAIREIVGLGNVQHLCVYFAGHGVNANRNELWLLSGAPEDPQEAVNVSSSVEFARYGTIPYVAIISDACRGAAVGLQMQATSGSDIFPNHLGGPMRFVDQFYACGLGRPAYEVERDGTYEAAYTKVLLAALEGQQAVEPPDPEYVRPRPLRDYLTREMGVLAGRGVEQAPEARLSSDPDAWISRLLDGPPPAARELRHGLPAPGRRVLGRADRDFERAGPDVRASRSTAGGMRFGLGAPWEYGGPDVTRLEEPVEHLAGASCSFTFRGATPVEAFTQSGGEAHVRSRTAVAVHVGSPRPRTVLVRLGDGVSIALPVLRGYDARVDFQQGEVVSVAYERRGSRAQGAMREVRALRAAAAVASRDGRFTLPPEGAEKLVGRMRVVKRIDPALAIYAAYAYADMGRPDLVREMATFVRSDIEGVLFDIAMLSGRHRDRDRDRVVGNFPLLGQGWARLCAFDVPLPPALEGLERRVVPSLWTLFDADGSEQLAAALTRGEV